ncbi:MAG: hypothetical protein HY098_02670 [Nitrospinae bacterium]|nr:hypothetical protein [Nitrospinota bacterium]
MKIPGFNRASVEKNKVAGYLLSVAHPIGKHKARFFQQFGFSLERVELLKEALEKHATYDFIKAEKTDFGVRYIIDAPLESPDGRNPEVRSVWFVEKGDKAPRFVTAYPV